MNNPIVVVSISGLYHGSVSALLCDGGKNDSAQRPQLTHIKKSFQTTFKVISDFLGKLKPAVIQQYDAVFCAQHLLIRKGWLPFKNLLEFCIVGMISFLCRVFHCLIYPVMGGLSRITLLFRWQISFWVAMNTDGTLNLLNFQQQHLMSISLSVSDRMAYERNRRARDSFYEF